MKSARVFIVMYLTWAVTSTGGCGNKADKPREEQTSTATKQDSSSAQKVDLVSHFEGLAERSTAAMTLEAVTQGKDETWFRIKTWTTDVGIDVQKTSSLVSPYTAELSFVHHAGKTADTSNQQQAAKAELSIIGPPNTYKLHYALQNRKWVLKSVRIQLLNGKYERPDMESRLQKVAGDYPAIQGRID